MAYRPTWYWLDISTSNRSLDELLIIPCERYKAFRLQYRFEERFLSFRTLRKKRTDNPDVISIVAYDTARSMDKELEVQVNTANGAIKFRRVPT